MGMVGELEITLIVPTLQRGNASQDAPRPLSSVSQSVVGMPKLQRLSSYMSCARLTESAICAICDAERHDARLTHNDTITLPSQTYQ